MANYQIDYLDKIGSMIIGLGGTVPAMAEVTNFEARSLELLDSLNTTLGTLGGGGGSSYTRLDPRVQEWNNVAVSNLPDGAIYTFSSLPAGESVLAHLLVNAGLPMANRHLRISFESPDITKPVVHQFDYNNTYSVSDQSSVNASYFTGSSAYISVVPMPIIVPAVNQQIWAKRVGSYTSTQFQTRLWVLGYWS